MHPKLGISSLSLILISACAPTTDLPGPATPGATALPTPSATPSAQPSIAPTATPQPTPEPSPSITPAPTATPTPSASPSPTPTPSPEEETPIEIFETATLLVRIYDDKDSLLNNALLEINSNDPARPFSQEGSISDGVFRFENIPTGLILNIRATAPGYTTRTLYRTLGSREREQSLSFQGTSALSDKPEVIEVYPRRASSIRFDEPIELHFSENVNKESVEGSFAIQAANENFFSVGVAVPAGLSVRPGQNSVLMDRNHVEVEWLNDRQVRLRPKYGWPFTQNRDFRLTLSYNNGSGSNLTGSVRDTNNTQANLAEYSIDGENNIVESGPFWNGSRYHAFVPFSVTGMPDAIRATAAGGIQNEQQAFFIDFSDDLFFYLPSGTMIAGGMNGNSGLAPAGNTEVTPQAAARNYQLTCNDIPVNLPETASAVYDSPTRVRVFVPAGETLFNSGDFCSVSFSSIVTHTGQTISNPSLTFTAP